MFMKIKLSNIIIILSAIFYTLILIVFYKENVEFNNAGRIFDWVLGRSFFAGSLAWAAQNIYVSAIAFFFSSFMTQFVFTILVSIITFLVTINTSKKIFEYNGISSKFALIASILSVLIFFFSPVGTIGLINTQSAFIATQLAYGTNTLFKPRFYYAGIHWAYIPTSFSLLFLNKTINFLKSLKFTITKLIFGLFLISFAFIFLTLIGKTNTILIGLDTSVSFYLTISISITLIITNLLLYLFTKKRLYLNLSFISMLTFLLAFISAKTSNRILLTLIYYDFTVIFSFILLIFRRKSFNAKF